MKKIYLVRHGETLFNSKYRLQGACDSPLTEKGINQSKNARKYYEKNNIVFDKAYCSTQERAEDTLNLITDLEYKRLKEIKEWNFGKCEGLDEGEYAPDKRFWEENLTFENWWTEYGGESIKEVRDRFKKGLRDIVKDDFNSAIVVSHGSVIRSFLTDMFPSKEELEENNIGDIDNLMTFEFEVLDNGELRYIDSFIPKL